MDKTFAAFSSQQQTLLLLTCILTLISIGFHIQKKNNWAIPILLIASFTIRCCMALLDPFINLWDEQFHALVARNLMSHPLTPTLYANPVMGFDIANWTENHIWLHKQPLFMWQIAISLKLFGVNEFALRIPSALMGATMVLFLYRMGKHIVNSNVGYYAALLYTFSIYQLEFVSGFTQLDHNDAAFIFYVTASIWAWIEYYYTEKKWWLYVIGVSSGFAILTKWLVGLLVYAGWGVSLLNNSQSRFNYRAYLPLLKSFFISCLIFFPWQIYTRITFPAESKLESDYNFQHIFNALEGHTGSNWYHFDMISDQYGKLVPYLLLLAIILWVKNIKSKTIMIACLTFLLVPYIFFTIVKTKMPSFCIVNCSIVYILLGNMIYQSLEFTQTFNKKLVNTITVIILVAIVLWSSNIDKIATNHELPFPHYPFRVQRVVNTPVDKELSVILPSQDYCIFNCSGYNATLVMFYTGMPAYGFQLNQEDYQNLKERKIKIATFDDGHLPNYLKNDSTVFKIKRHLIQETY